MVAVGIMATTLATMSLTFLATNLASSKARRAARGETNAMLVAESGLSEAVYALEQGQQASLGSNQQPLDFGGARFWVEAQDLGSGMTSIVSTGVDGHSGARLELVVRATSSSVFQWGAFGDEDFTMDANSHVDSYDSTAGTYADQEVNGSGNDTWAGEDGDVGSNSSVVVMQNADVHGNAVCGPSGTVTVTGNATVSGSTSPAASTMDMPALDIPVFPSVGDLIVPGGDTTVLPPGDHEFDQLYVDTGAELVITGPATVVFDSFELRSNSNLWVDASGGPVDIFVRDDFVMNSNTLIASTGYLPGDVRINLESDNVINPDVDVNVNPDEVTFDSNSKMYGTIYAPNAAVEIDSNFELFGSVVARSLLLDSNSEVHYDIQLGSSSSTGATSFEMVSWRELPYSANSY